MCSDSHTMMQVTLTERETESACLLEANHRLVDENAHLIRENAALHKEITILKKGMITPETLTEDDERLNITQGYNPMQFERPSLIFWKSKYQPSLYSS